MILIAENRKLQISAVSSSWTIALGLSFRRRIDPSKQQGSTCKGDQKTFAEIADTIMYMTLNEGHHSERIDVVFDVYKEESIKNAEREKRGSSTGH